MPSGPAAGWISQSAKRDFPTRRTELPARSLSGLINGSVVRVTAAGARRSGAERGRRAARREVGLVSSNGQSGLPHGKSGPAPCHTVRQPIDAFPCRSLRRSRRASRQSSATFSVSASGLMVARSSRLGHSGSRLPGHRYEPSRHGLAASRPRTPGSGASAVTPPPTKPSSRLGTRHIERCNAVVRSAPLPVRHPGPRVTAAGRCTPAPSGPATTASQSGQRHASYHPPRPIMSAARDRMLSTPCRARLRAARHYRIPAPGDMPRRTPSAASGRRPVVTGVAPQIARPTNTATAQIIASLARLTSMSGRPGSPPAGRSGRSRRPSAATPWPANGSTGCGVGWPPPFGPGATRASGRAARCRARTRPRPPILEPDPEREPDGVLGRRVVTRGLAPRRFIDQAAAGPLPSRRHPEPDAVLGPHVAARGLGARARAQ